MRKHEFSIGAAIIVATAFFACDDSPGTPANETTATASASAKPPPPDEPEEKGVTIIDKGKEPRRLLRYRPKKGQQEKLELTLETTSEEAGINKRPATTQGSTFRLHLLHNDGSKPGKLSYTIKILECEPNFGDTVPAAQKTAVTKIMADLKGITGRIEMSDRGVATDVSLNPGDVSDDVKAVVAELESSLGTNIFVLPTARVGVGALWKHERPIESFGAITDQVANYELVALDGDTVKVKVITKDTAKDQVAKIGKGLEMKLLEGQGKLEGEVTLSLLHIAPVEGAFNGENKTKMQLGSRPEKVIKSVSKSGVKGGIE